MDGAPFRPQPFSPAVQSIVAGAAAVGSQRSISALPIRWPVIQRMNPQWLITSVFDHDGSAAISARNNAARATIDEKERLAHYADALRILHEDVPGVGMFQYHAIYAARRELQWQPTAGESFHVFDMKWQN